MMSAVSSKQLSGETFQYGRLQLCSLACLAEWVNEGLHLSLVIKPSVVQLIFVMYIAGHLELRIYLPAV